MRRRKAELGGREWPKGRVRWADGKNSARQSRGDLGRGGARMASGSRRAAPGWLNMLQEDLAKLAGVAPREVRDFESHRGTVSKLEARVLEVTLESFGVGLLFGDDGRAVGVRGRPKTRAGKARPTGCRSGVPPRATGSASPGPHRPGESRLVGAGNLRVGAGRGGRAALDGT